MFKLHLHHCWPMEPARTALDPFVEHIVVGGREWLPHPVIRLIKRDIAGQLCRESLSDSPMGLPPTEIGCLIIIVFRLSYRPYFKKFPHIHEKMQCCHIYCTGYVIPLSVFFSNYNVCSKFIVDQIHNSMFQYITWPFCFVLLYFVGVGGGGYWCWCFAVTYFH